MRQAGAELCQAQVKLGVIVYIGKKLLFRVGGWVAGEIGIKTKLSLNWGWNWVEAELGNIDWIKYSLAIFF